MPKDVVCGMTIDPNAAPAESQYKGQTFYFCSKGCKAAFDKNPDKYVAAQPGEHTQHYH